MLRMVTILAGALLTGAAPVFAQAPQQRTIMVSADAPFAHANSGLTLPATLIDLPRTRVLEVEAPQLDIAAEYMRGDAPVLTVYVYRSTVGSVPVWFDRARWAIESRPVYGKPTLAAPVAAIAARDGAVASGLIAGWSLSGSSYRGTAVAILPHGEWLVKLRYSSQTEDGVAAAAKLRDAIAAIAWPKPKGNAVAVAAVPVADCATPLGFDASAASLPPDPNAMLMGALAAGLAGGGPAKAKRPPAPPPVWCRDPAAVPMGAVYRPGGSTDTYLLALSDAGRGVSVYPSVASQVGAEIDKTARKLSWSVDLALPGRTVIYPLQSALPPPARVMAALNEAPLSSITTWGDKRQVTLPSNFGKK